MASLNTRLTALEVVAAGRFGEYQKPESTDTLDALEPTSNNGDVLPALVEILKELDNKMSKLTDAMQSLVKETSEMGSAIDAYKAQQDATIALLRENAGDPDAVLQIANTLEAYQQRLASAVVVNTPAVDANAVEPAVPVADPVAAPLTAEEVAAVSNSTTVAADTV